MSVWAVVMAGGRGTRFWPLSRTAMPKQCLSLCSQYPLVTETLHRVESLVQKKHALIITNEEQVPALKKVKTPVMPSNIIAEPVGRNTAPCLGLASYLVGARGSDEDVIIALPADHLIKDVSKYRRILARAVKTAQKEDCIVTLGITPTAPETGYGYIEVAQAKTPGGRAIPVKRFVEKPDKKTARHYMKKGTFYWNSGMFVFRTSVMKDAIKKYLPSLHQGLQPFAQKHTQGSLTRTLRRAYKKLPSISIDYGVMEKFPNVLMHKADMGWNDLGAWNVLSDVLKRDRCGNICPDNAYIVDGKRNIVVSEGKTVALLGVDDIAVISTHDALLVMDKSRSQDVRDIVDLLEKEERYDLL